MPLAYNLSRGASPAKDARKSQYGRPTSYAALLIVAFRSNRCPSCIAGTVTG